MMHTVPAFYKLAKLLRWKSLTNFDKFDKWRAIRQSFPFQCFPC